MKHAGKKQPGWRLLFSTSSESVLARAAVLLEIAHVHRIGLRHALSVLYQYYYTPIKRGEGTAEGFR